MHTGPRVASAALRCSSFSPSRISTAPPYPRRWTALDELLSRKCVFFGGALRRRGVRELRDAHHRRQARDDLERLRLAHQPLELAELLLEPGRVDDRPADAHDL